MSLLGFLFVSQFAAGDPVGKTTSLVELPAGSVEAIWLSPVSKKVKSTSTTRWEKVGSFKIQEHQVTVGDFRMFIARNPKWAKNKISPVFADKNYLSDLDSPHVNARSPVTFVSWFVARAYCADLGLRLPTVNEWEYAAAASETSADANRDPTFLRRILDWYGHPQDKALPRVGRIYKNLYGVWDMHGLVWEWVDDFNSSFVTGESREDGSLNKDMFCGAGGMSSTDRENYAAFMRFAFRSSLKGNSTVWNLGFRCAK